ncbi:MAG TPA: hypothetical protein VN282_08675 [Pyrinomonadaceae bacterium]|nr:hypothetical protein [Pyrinomonadaceae bacterium]
MAQTVEGTQGELARRHATAANVVKLVGVFTLLLMLVALSGFLSGAVRFNPVAANTLRFVVVFLGVGAIVFRRTRFQAMRLQDIAALRGASGLLETLQTTTVIVAVIAAVIAVLGLLISVMTGAGTDMLYFGVIAVAVLVYCYPRRAAWVAVVRAADGGEGDPVRAAKGTLA